MADSEWVKGEPKVLAQLVLHGINGPITVKGQQYQGAMPAFAEQFSDAELAAVFNFIRHEWGNEAEAVTPELVAEARAASADRSQPWQGEKELQDWIAAQ
ncbi:cytochrome c [Alcaligenes faecalis]|uniref:c-type cytochrome n=1 Tax=Alcaligenes faecalis TaxID=511 RepID=UPI003083B224